MFVCGEEKSDTRDLIKFCLVDLTLVVGTRPLKKSFKKMHPSCHLLALITVPKYERWTTLGILEALFVSPYSGPCKMLLTLNSKLPQAAVHRFLHAWFLFESCFVNNRPTN
jgi:hypothetical protein